jgi:hypothetical protein
MPRLTVCERARQAARGRDDPSSRLIELLKRPIAKHEQHKIDQRVQDITSLFRSLSPEQKAALRYRLNDPADALGRFFDCELDRRFRRRLRGMLDVPRVQPTPVRATAPATGPVWRPPPDRVSRFRYTNDRPTEQTERDRPPPPKEHRRRPPKLPRIRHIPVREILDHARRVLEALRVAGYTGGTVTGLAATIADVAPLLGTLGVTSYLVYDLASGTLGVNAKLITHRGEQYILNQAARRPEWRRVEQALQKLHRLDERALERLEQRQPVLAPDAGASDGGPPPGDGGNEPRRRRTVTGYHGANGDAILGILSNGRIWSRGGKVWLNLGDHRRSYMHGGDRKRGANFVAEVQVSYDPALVKEERKSTAGILDTLVLHTSESLPTTVTRMFRRRMTEEGRAEDVFEGRAAIEAALR